MELTQRRACVWRALYVFAFFALANGACFEKEESGELHCCDQRENDGPLFCCPGRNSSCGVEDFVNKAVCFCDEFCQTAGDCCSDFETVKQICGIGTAVKRDCEVSAWSEWGKCSPNCGVGESERTRTVLVRPTNGGKKCPPLKEKKGCFRHLCGGRELGFARILPHQYKIQRRRSRWENILPAARFEVKEKEPRRPSYCVNYKIYFKHPHCKETWADKLDPQKPICVECEHDAMNKHGRCKGQGISGEVTLWEAVDIKNCYGGWLKIGPKIPDCKCDNKEFNNFIFI